MLSNELSKRDNAQKTSDEFVQFYDIAFLKQLVIKIVPSIQLVIYEPSLNVFFKVIENIDLSFLF